MAKKQDLPIPASADLAETLDAPQTEEIKALAAKLENNPHKIYQWLHDNIYFFPSYGSVQGAQDTLDKKSGNAFDTASLMIATLRAAKIPARYVYGTVDIPIEQVMNWVGGAQNVEAAQQILGQGGIPNIALTRGGKISGIRIEHVWVEAYIRYSPDRGAKHKGGQTQGDSWIPMDPSYKQYTYNPGMDLQSQVPFDAEAFMKRAQQGATVNEAEGWVQNLNQANMQADMQAYQAKLKAHIDAQNNGKSTVGQVLGYRNAQIDTLPYLAGTLPYTIKTTAARYSEIPNNLRHQFRYRIYPDQYAYNLDAADGSPGSGTLLDFQMPTVQLAGKKLTLAWVAATDKEQAAIDAMMPKPHADGSPIQPSELPRGLGAHILLKPELRLEGQTKATGEAMRTGSEPIGAGAFTQYSDMSWDETTDQLIAGQQSALGVSIQGVSAKQMETLKTRMEASMIFSSSTAWRRNIIQILT